jgi:hypothetical protein
VVTFPGTFSEAKGVKTYVLTTVSASGTFQVQRASAGQPTTLSFELSDGCGGWDSFVGGGTDAGF